MVPEEIKELNEESLSEFLSENENEIREGKNHAIAKLQKKVNQANKQNNQVEENNLLKEAPDVSEVTMFVRKCPPEKLMTIALLDRKSLSKAYSNPDSTVRQRAIFYFASDKSVKAAIRAFRVQYPKWKKAKHLLPLEVEPNNNTQTQLELTKVLEGKMKKKKKAVLGANENKSKMKKKSGKKSLKRKKEVEGDGSEGNGSCEMPQKKKVKNNSDVNNSSNTEEEKNTESGEEKVNSPQKLSKKIGKKQNNLKKKQNKLKNKENNVKNKKNKVNAIEKVLLNGTDVITASYLNLSPSSSPTAADRKVDAKAGQRQENPRKGQEGKFHRKSNSKQGLADRSKNWKPNFASKRNFNSRRGRPQPKWAAKKFADKNSVNMIDVSPDWREKCASPKTDDGEKPSLLRPSWLTNPEERKPMPSYNPGRRFERKENHPGRRFERKENHSANMIRVTDEWKNKPTTPKTDDAPATSLLRPSWLTNPQPAPVKKFQGNSKKFQGNSKKFQGNFKKFK